MEFALFNPPFNRPERAPREVFDWAVRLAVIADEAGCPEYWVGEHATMDWESIPSPELVLAAAVKETDTVKLCPGAHLLPYHHPATLAVQTAWLSHVARGRYILGIGAGAYPSDAAVRGLATMAGNHEMFAEALQIMHQVWAGEPFEFTGRYWNAGFPGPPPGGSWRSPVPYGGEMPIAMAGISADSPTMTFAGERGYIPMSIYAGDERVINHWETYAAAAERHGIVTNRKNLRVSREVLCADTDKEARRRAIEGGLGQAWQNYLLPAYKKVGGLLDAMIPDPSIDPMSVDLDYLADNVWIVGSPDTVAEKLSAAAERVGGWGTTLVMCHDYMDDPQVYEHSTELLTKEVGPRVKTPL